ncbi:helix-turn-helix domain-containing protein [Paenibacillus allorhizosphaerae]|uniref:HTH-type transcriptional activator RhaR n=1 Tax=Paenibacillus allorhizosphaerae TaxID=2849866 RepID=A0ABM8VHU7_9BACL|nr:AraC family transcriptional regulator [Paenibacillus allorhizosphaerae]CAG7643057.1 HTH-type transcriptional activator RhaR [Paenibacillus allorhizosphaerae]
MTIRKSMRTLKGKSYFEPDFPVYVNRAVESFSLLEHGHDFMELCYVAEGGGYQYIGEQTLPVKQGDWFFIPVGVSHVFRPAHADTRSRLIVYNCIFSPEMLDRITESQACLLPEEELSVFRLLRQEMRWLRAKEQSNEIHTLMSRLHLEYTLHKEARRTMIVSCLTQLIVAFARSVYSEETAAADKGETRFDEVLLWIEHNSEAPPLLEEAAARLNVGKRHFQRLFVKATGQTYSDYIQTIRVHRCCELLRTTDWKVYAVAERAGFKDMKHFYALFKRKTGMTPGEFRQS